MLRAGPLKGTRFRPGATIFRARPPAPAPAAS